LHGQCQKGVKIWWRVLDPSSN